MLKASAGGGGKGIRKVEKSEDLVAAFESASSEAQAAFGNGAMYMERVIYPARHIEVQILADQHGHVIHLGERDCSLQRNNQKVLEESPSIAIGKLFVIVLVLQLFVQLSQLVTRMLERLNSCMMKARVSSTLWK